MPNPTIPQDPLARFLDIAAALTATSRWWENRAIVRYAALPLVLAPGEPAAIAARLTGSIRQIADEAGWLSPLRGAIRAIVAALMLGDGRDPAAFAKALDDLRERFRTAGVRRGGESEVIAAAMLHVTDHTTDADVRRLQEVYDGMKQHHWWLTGIDDLPAAALLSVRGKDLTALSSRIEAIFAALQARGFGASNGLQIASHVLSLAPGDATTLAARFGTLHDGFRDADVRMWDCDRDELALLCLLDEVPAMTIARVVDHRAAIRTRLKHTGAVTSFSLACGTAWLAAHAGRALDPALASDLQVANLVLAVNACEQLRQQQAAAATAAT